MTTKQDLEYFRIKANQHWEMAGLARQDGDKQDEIRHTELAREFAKKAAQTKVPKITADQISPQDLADRWG